MIVRKPLAPLADRIAKLAAGVALAGIAAVPLMAQAGQQKGAGAFKATLAPIRADKALDFWYRTPQASGPNLTVVERVHPHDAVLLVVLLEGIGDDGGGKGRVTLRISAIDAAGETSVLAEDVPAWDEKRPPTGIIVISRTLPEFGFDDQEPMGKTTLVVEARDEGSGTTARTEAGLELVRWTYGQIPADAKACQDWVLHYYRAPAPGQAVRAYLEYAEVESEKSKSLNFAELGFYRTVFQGSPWLVDHLVDRFADGEPMQKTKIAMMLQLLGQGERIEKLFDDPADGAKARAMMQELLLPDQYDTISGPAQLDLLWGEFLATGRYAPVRQLVTALDLAPFEDEIEKFPKSAKTKKDQELFMKGVTFKAARWSLDSNMTQHPLVLAYAGHIAEHEKLGKDERKQLEELLGKHGGKPKPKGPGR